MKCRGPNCGAEVVFVPSAKSGKPMILDAKPRKGVVLTYRPLRVNPSDVSETATGRGEPLASVVDVYTPHHATCPDVGRF